MFTVIIVECSMKSGLFIVVVQELHCFPNCLQDQELEISITSSNLIALHLLVSETAKCIA